MEEGRASSGEKKKQMGRGSKRGNEGVIDTQRLDKRDKNVADEGYNFLMGRTFLDIDMARAADLLGMERRQAEAIRDLEPGHFLGLGPAISRRPLSVRIGSTQTYIGRAHVYTPVTNAHLACQLLPEKKTQHHSPSLNNASLVPHLHQLLTEN